MTVQDSLCSEDFNEIAVKVRALRSEILAWRRDFNMALIHAIGEPKRNDGINTDKRYELISVALVIQILASRMLVFISPDDRGILEEEAQSYAMEIRSLQGSTGHHRRAEFILTQKSRIADAVINTHDVFAATAGNGRIIEPWRLKQFCKLLGKKSCDGVSCCA